MDNPYQPPADQRPDLPHRAPRYDLVPAAALSLVCWFVMPHATFGDKFLAILIIAVSLLLIIANRFLANGFPQWVTESSSPAAVYWTGWLLLTGTVIFAIYLERELRNG